MRCNSLRSLLNFFAACVFLLSSHCTAQDLVYVSRTTTCTSAWSLGRSIFCCDGACLDGTNTFGVPGLCFYWLNFCYDVLAPAVCLSNKEVFIIDSYGGGVDAGIGVCYSPSPCYWGQLNYTWSCCECPQGFVAVASNCVDATTLANSGECMGCGPGYATSYNSTSNGYFCVDEALKPTLCNAGNYFQDSLETLSQYSTWVGAICLPKKPLDVVEALLEDILSVMKAIIHPTNGYTGTKFDAGSAVIATMYSFALAGLLVAGVIELPIEGAILVAAAEIYDAVCIVNGLLGLILPILMSSGDWAQKAYCSAPAKRSIPSGTSFDFHLPSAACLSNRQSTTYNPCEEIINLFPSNYTLPAAVNDACNQAQYYDAAGLNDTVISEGMTSMQQFCANYSANGMSDFMVDFGNLLGALEAAIPYCNWTGGPMFTLSSTLSSTESVISSAAPSSTLSFTGSTSSSPAPSSTFVSSSSSSVPLSSSRSMSVSSASNSISSSTHSSTLSGHTSTSPSSPSKSTISTQTSQSSSSSTESRSSTNTVKTTSTSAKVTTTTHIQTSSTATTPKWTSLGCYSDNALGRGRTLTKRKSIAGRITVEACEKVCLGAGYMYAGLEHGKECWCGNSFANGGVYLGPDGTNGCVVPCVGDVKEICGGSKRLSVYWWH